MPAPGVELVDQSIRPRHLRLRAEVVYDDEDARLVLALLGAAQLDDGELLVDDALHGGEDRLVEEEGLVAVFRG